MARKPKEDNSTNFPYFFCLAEGKPLSPAFRHDWEADLYSARQGWSEYTVQTGDYVYSIESRRAELPEFYQFVCTRNELYLDPLCLGYDNPEMRQQIYLDALSHEDAIAQMMERFPYDSVGFTARQLD